MRIAIATEAAETSSQVSQLGARAPYFIVFYDSGSQVEAFANPFLDMSRLVGPNVAKMLTSKRVGLVIAGRFGRNFAAALKAEGIEHRAFSGAVKQVIARVIEDLST